MAGGEFGRSVRDGKPAGAPYDPALLLVVVALVAVGVIMVYSSSAILAWQRYNDLSVFLRRQALWTLVGAGLMVVMMRRDYRTLHGLAFPLLLLTSLMLVVVLLPWVGREVGGARRWISLGPVAFQPAEFAKLALVIYLAHSLVKKADKRGDFTFGYLPHLLVLGILFLLLLCQPDLGTGLIILVVGLGMCFVAGTPLRLLLPSVLVALPFLYVAVAGTEYRLRRVAAFLDPWSDSTDAGFQAVQSFLALGRGGLWGLGLGQGTQKLFYLPEAHTDFIFSVIGEELGLIGALAVLLLFAFLICRGMRVAWGCRDPFGMYLAFGLVLLVGGHAIANFGVATGLLPTKGIALPFISLGGSSLIANMMAVGIVLNISRHVPR